MSLLSWLDDPSAEKGIHFAPDSATQKWPFSTYAELASEVYRTAATLLDHGLERGGIVSLLLSDPRDFVIAFYAAIAAGGTAVPIAAPSFRSTAALRQHLITVFRTCMPRIVVGWRCVRARDHPQGWAEPALSLAHSRSVTRCRAKGSGDPANRRLDVTSPVLLFCLAFGLAMDYQIMLLARIREEYDRSGDTRQAVIAGVGRTSTLLSAGAVLVSVVFIAIGNESTPD